MQKGHFLEFKCLSCQEPIAFSLFELDKPSLAIQCPKCRKHYILDDENLKRQVKKFAALCEQLIESEEILSNASIGVDVGEHHIKIPYKLLLTRLNSTLDLKIGNTPVSIVFRIEPLKVDPS